MHLLKIGIPAVVFAAVLAAGSGPAFAHGGGKWACRQDVQKFCPDITPGPGGFKAVHQCLEQNAANLSAACQKQMAAMETKADEILAACQSDVSSLCSAAGADKGATIRCLYENRSEVSDTCRAQLHRHHHHRHHHHNAAPTPGSAQ